MNWIWLGLLIFLKACLWQPVKPPPLVVFIAIDDLRPQTGAFGADYMHTPALDSFCRDAWYFTNHYVVAPSCGPSRYALLSGQYPRQWRELENNVFEQHHNTVADSLPESFVEQFRSAGYHTIGIGKISHSPDGRIYGYDEKPGDALELPRSWDEMYLDPGKWQTGWNAFFGYADGSDRNSLDNQVLPYERASGGDTLYVDGWIADEAIRRISALKQSPVPTFLALGFFKPHLPFTAPDAYWQRYDTWEDTADYPLVDDPAVQSFLHNNGEFNRYALGEAILLPDRAASDVYAQKLRRAYAASVSYVDAQVGKVIQELKAAGLYEEATIVIWGDHGWHLGEKGIWGKHTLFDVALRSPLMIKPPAGKKISGSGAIADIVSTVDIYPTLLELAGLNPKLRLPGRSLVSRMKGHPIPLSEQKAVSFWRRSASIRTPDYRLIKSYREEQTLSVLFEMQHADHHEGENLAGTHPGLVDSLSQMLNSFSMIQNR